MSHRRFPIHAAGEIVPLHAVAPKRLYRQIADQIASLIASGEFPPGARLPAERELATSLGVSRASVREAIISLEIGGLVEVRVGTGIFVSPPAMAAPAAAGDAGPGPFELLDARRLVEGEIAALAARNAGPEDIAVLRDIVARMRLHLDDFRAREESDREFHMIIAKATGNGSLELVVAALWSQRAELWGRLQKHFHTVALAHDTVRDHDAILGAIERHDPAAARNAMRRHIGRVAREFQRGLDSSAGPLAPPDRAPLSPRRRSAAPPVGAKRQE